MNIGMFKLLLCPGAGVAPAEVQRLSRHTISPTT